VSYKPAYVAEDVKPWGCCNNPQKPSEDEKKCGNPECGNPYVALPYKKLKDVHPTYLILRRELNSSSRWFEGSADERHHGSIAAWTEQGSSDNGSRSLGRLTLVLKKKGWRSGPDFDPKTYKRDEFTGLSTDLGEEFVLYQRLSIKPTRSYKSKPVVSYKEITTVPLKVTQRVSMEGFVAACEKEADPEPTLWIQIPSNKKKKGKSRHRNWKPRVNWIQVAQCPSCSSQTMCATPLGTSCIKESHKKSKTKHCESGHPWIEPGRRRLSNDPMRRLLEEIQNQR